MPVITISRGYLNRLLGRDIGDDELNSVTQKIGAEIEKFAGSEVLVEMPPNRSDMYSIEGFVRALKGIMGTEIGLPPYSMTDSGIVLNLDDSVKDVRPYVVGGLARGFELDDDCVKSLMDLQEKIHLTIGRNRKKVSIGIHDFDQVKPGDSSPLPKRRRWTWLKSWKAMRRESNSHSCSMDSRDTRSS
jgi:phenylalanyl-tRNA synthetase beta chain